MPSGYAFDYREIWIDDPGGRLRLGAEASLTAPMPKGARQGHRNEKAPAFLPGALFGRKKGLSGCHGILGGCRLRAVDIRFVFPFQFIDQAIGQTQCQGHQRHRGMV